MSLLQKKFPYLLNIRQNAVAEKLNEDKDMVPEALSKNIEDPKIIFENFLKFEKVIEENIPDEKQNLFKEILNKQSS